MKGKWVLLSLSAILLAVAAGAIGLLRQDRQQKEAPQQKAPEKVVQDLQEVSLSGRIQAQNVVPVAAPVEGTLEAFFADVGDGVYQGQLLARIRSSALTSQHEAATREAEDSQSRMTNLEGIFSATRLEASRARADATRARSEKDRTARIYERQKMLYGEGATPRLTYEKAEREYKTAELESNTLESLAQAAESRLAGLQIELDNARKRSEEMNRQLEDSATQLAAGEIHSPVDGLITARRGLPGDIVNPAMADLFKIAMDLSSLEVVLEPDPAVLARIRPDQPAMVLVAEDPEGFAGRVKSVENGQVIVEFKSPNPAVRPGLSAQVKIRLT
ncbi:MAG: HlyD family secretion protein [Bryobacteraceae bacterium]